MNKQTKLVIIVIALIALVGACYFALMPQYKEIQMSGYTFEVPSTNVQVKNNSNNYNTYLDTEYDLNIKTWSCKDINDLNGTMNASVDMGTQLGENFGNNVTYNNISLMNKSGIYTYYEVDDKNSCIIIITSKNLKIIEHILETMTKPKLNVENNPFKLGSVGNSLNISSKASTLNDQTVSSKKTSTTQKTNNNQKNSGSDSYYYTNDPEANGEFEGVGEAVYKNTKTGKIYVERGRGNLQRAPELDYSY